MPLGDPTGFFWGKFGVDAETGSTHWHPLPHHCADVAACAEALLDRTLLGQRLARLAGQAELTPSQKARLSVLAAIHDFGKFAIGFQNKRLGKKAPFSCGHLGEALGLVLTEGYAFTEPAWEALALDEIRGWGDEMIGLLSATISHHGRPLSPTRNMRTEWWAPSGRLDPFAGMTDLLDDVRSWFPSAWERDGDRLPHNPEFQHAWAGLLNLADWIGSDSDRFFPFSRAANMDRMAHSRVAAARAMMELGLETTSYREAIESLPITYGTLLNEGASPRPAQQRMLEVEIPRDGGSIVVLEAATGSGKTEASLVHFLRLFQRGAVDGIYFALPLRAAATQIHHRVCKAVRSTFPADRRPAVVLAVPGYRRVNDVDGKLLAPFNVYWPNDDDVTLRYRGWAAENPKRFLAGAVVVGTIDQALLSSLQVAHAHLRAAALLRHLLVVDEVHASDQYMTRILEDVLDRHVASGGHALLMSATLGCSTRTRLVSQAGFEPEPSPPSVNATDAQEEPYPLITVASSSGIRCLPVNEESSDEKEVTFSMANILDEAEQIASTALAAARRGARVLVIRNTVAACQELQEALELLAASSGENHLLFTCGQNPAPHHSRFASVDRNALDEALELAYGEDRPTETGLVTAATQTVEQSLDLDADFLLTDLCPIDVLLQRVGRLHRHARERARDFERAHAIVLVPGVEVEDLSNFISDSGEARGPHGLGTVYEDLRTLQLTWELLAGDPNASIPRDNRRLVESATHAEILADLATSRGEKWRSHERWITGSDIADRGVAKLNIIPRGEPFERLRFVSDRKISTRLGEQDRLAQFKPPVAGPFGQEVTEIAIRDHMVARGTPADISEAADVNVAGGVIHFTYGPRQFVYDRLGLRQARAE